MDGEGKGDGVQASQVHRPLLSNCCPCSDPAGRHALLLSTSQPPVKSPGERAAEATHCARYETPVMGVGSVRSTRLSRHMLSSQQ